MQSVRAEEDDELFYGAQFECDRCAKVFDLMLLGYNSAETGGVLLPFVVTGRSGNRTITGYMICVNCMRLIREGVVLNASS